MDSQILLAFTTVSLGAFLGALGNKLVTHNSQTRWKWAFYVLGILSVIFSVFYFIVVDSFVTADYAYLIILFTSGIFLIIFTRKFLDKKYVYKTSELDPIVNSFTTSADTSEIKLFGGDLNFFGNTPNDMDANSQYNHLKSIAFKKVSILCETPGDIYTKIRYGKILHDMGNAELRFYNPNEADLRIRGRLKTLQGVEKLLIYSKIESKKYHAIETDTANSNGALYNNIWKLAWSLANKLKSKEREELINLIESN